MWRCPERRKPPHTRERQSGAQCHDCTSRGQVTLPRRHTAEDPELLQGFKWLSLSLSLSLARAAFMSLSADFESVTLSVRSKNHTRVGTRKITRSISPLASRPLQGVRSATQRQRWAVDLLTPLQPPQKPCSALQKASLRVAEVVPGGRGGPCCVENCMTFCKTNLSSMLRSRDTAEDRTSHHADNSAECGPS